MYWDAPEHREGSESGEHARLGCLSLVPGIAMAGVQAASIGAGTRAVFTVGMVERIAGELEEKLITGMLDYPPSRN